MTPEGRIKRSINKLLDSYGGRIYKYMPVPTGYGKRTLDYLVCVSGVFLAIEAKAPGERPTSFQEATLADITLAGGTTMVISDDAGVENLRLWIDTVLEGAL